jgi:hypothetical protein
VVTKSVRAKQQTGVRGNDTEDAQRQSTHAKSDHRLKCDTGTPSLSLTTAELRPRDPHSLLDHTELRSKDSSGRIASSRIPRCANPVPGGGEYDRSRNQKRET